MEGTTPIRLRSHKQTIGFNLQPTSPIFEKFTSFRVGQFLSVQENFLLAISGDSFSILPQIECSSILQFGVQSQNIT